MCTPMLKFLNSKQFSPQPSLAPTPAPQVISRAISKSQSELTDAAEKLGLKVGGLGVRSGGRRGEG